jgi:predicted P-loop ATPase
MIKYTAKPQDGDNQDGDKTRIKKGLSKARVIMDAGALVEMPDNVVAMPPGAVPGSTTTKKARPRVTPPSAQFADDVPGMELIDFGFQRGAMGQTIPCLDGVCRVLEKHSRWAGKIWYDTFLEKVQYEEADGTTTPWTDHLTGWLTRWIQSVFELPTLGSERVHEAVMLVAQGQPRNVLKTWLESLQWDGTHRLREALVRGFGAAENEYTQKVGECWFISLAARALRPGCKVDTMPVFEGGQGIGKSTALAILGGDWFGEMHEDFGSKDFVLSLKGKWLIEVAEMHAFGKTDVDRLKGILSTRVDRIRRPYGRTTEEHPRQSVFAGTTNRDDWQQDDTGARRFWPIRCGTIDLDWLRDNRDQLYAEAVMRFQAGEDWWSVPIAQAAAEADRRRVEDPWAASIQAWLVPGREYSTNQIMTGALVVETKDFTDQKAKRVARVMRLLGWVQTYKRVDTGTVRLWKSSALPQ